jgi:hypothetical protein
VVVSRRCRLCNVYLDSRASTCSPSVRLATPGITLWETEAALGAWERGLQGRDRRGCAEDPRAAAALCIEDREDLSQALQFASGNGSALRPSARQVSDGSVLPSRQAFRALMAMATSASRPDSVEY